MKRIIYIALTIIILIPKSGQASDCYTMDYWVHAPGTVNYHQIVSRHDDSASAIAARDQYKTDHPEIEWGTSDPQENLGTYGGYTEQGGENGEGWNLRFCYYGDGEGYYWFFNFVWPTDGIDGCSGEGDNDEDGMPDNKDISSGTDCPYWHVIKEVTDLSGTCIYYAEIMTSNEEFYSFGDEDIINKAMAGDYDVVINEYGLPMYDYENDEWIFNVSNTCDNIDEYMTPCIADDLVLTGYDESEEEPISSQIEDGSYAEQYELESGEDNTGNTLETDYLYDIVENTKDIADNQQTISDQLSDIESAIREQGSSSIGNDNDETLTAQQQQDIINLDSQDTGQGDYEIESGDITPAELTDYDDEISNFQNLDIIDETEIILSEPSCYFEVDLTLMGEQKTITFSFCEYEDWLDLFGGFILLVASFYYIVIVFKG